MSRAGTRTRSKQPWQPSTSTLSWRRPFIWSRARQRPPCACTRYRRRICALLLLGQAWRKLENCAACVLRFFLGLFRDSHPPFFVLQTLHKWSDAVAVAEARNHPDLHEMRNNYSRWLTETGQEETAGEMREVLLSLMFSAFFI